VKPPYRLVSPRSSIAVLDGVVETLWVEVESAAPAGPGRRQSLSSFAHALRDVVHRHPNAAPLITSRQIMPEPAKRLIQSHISAATDAGQVVHARPHSDLTYPH
jgi:hypothetical protein